MSTFEQQYLAILDDIRRHGHLRHDRTGVGAYSLWGREIRHDLNAGFPAITTKRLAFRTMAHELAWLLSGSTNIRPLVAQGVSIWTDNALKHHNISTGKELDRATFENRILNDDAFAEKWGDLGPIYGAQWRAWTDARGRVHDQVKRVQSALRNNPDSRRILFTGWNAGEIDLMTLPPCHHTYQFTVLDGRLHAFVYQRSCDMFLGVPFNIASLALLTHILASTTGCPVGEIIWYGTDVHVYANHLKVVDEQLARTPVEHTPRLMFNTVPADVDDFAAEHVDLVNYEHHPALAAPIAV